MKRLFDLLRSEDGAVTVDWMMLTAAVLLLGVVTSISTFGKVVSATENLAAYISSSVAVAGQD
ncbi:hypothetical protein [Rhodobacter sp. CZR27]|uniref:hypothetical protein n=1 Tax=Rhodobacter sp. CZR27 TaxID=2033869 RepID=UPI000BBE5B2E|nr:hypothetical protein [Rhodobacter sp. CZR27]